MNERPTSFQTKIDKPEQAPGAQNEFRYKFEGAHDYLSNIRMYGYMLSKHGKSGLLNYIKENKLPTFREYFDKVNSTNENLKTKIEHDLAAYPGILNKIDSMISAMNSSTNEEEAFDAYNSLKNFFQ